MSDFTHDDDLFSVVADDAVDVTDSTDGVEAGTVEPLWHTDGDGAVLAGATPNPDGSFGDPGYDPFVVDSDQDGIPDAYDVTPMGDPYDVPQGAPGATYDTPYGQEPGGYDPYADPYADPYGDPYGQNDAPWPDDPAGWDGGDPGGGYENTYAPYGAWFDENGELQYTATDWAPEDFDGIGDPVGDAQYWQAQTSPTSCAVVTQGMIIEKLTGEPLDEAALMQQAEQAGIYDPENGTQLEDVGKVLEMHGVDADQIQGADINTLLEALASGDQVIVGIDAKEMWMPLHDAGTDMPLEQDPPMGHAAWVTGIDQQPDGSIVVLLNDPGGPFGQCEAVPLEDFLQAWDDYGNNMTVAHPVAA